MATPPIDLVHQSLKRCHQHPDFMARFYDAFLAASPTVREKFKNTDMKRQQMMVEASLYTCLLAADDVPYAVQSIRHLGRLHHHLDIGRGLYDLWLDSLLATVATCDDAFDADVEAAWRTTLRQSIDRMLAQENA